MQQKYINCKGLKEVLKDVRLLNHPRRKEIERRIEIITFFKKHKIEATRDAYKVSKSTIYNWIKTLEENGGDITSLASRSKEPKKKRESKVSEEIKRFIVKYRYEHPRVGQVVIKQALEKYKGFKTISEATIGRIIAKLKEERKIIDNPKKISFYASSGRFKQRIKKKRKKVRVKGYKPKEGGDLMQIDSITLFANGIKKYIISCVDIKTRFGYACSYSSLTSMNAKDFIEKVIRVCPFKIKRIQTDNGLEFEKYFAWYLGKQNIIHYHNYPRSPKSNAYIERFNRTIQEQFVDWQEDSIFYNLEEFNKNLVQYLVWYNTERPHQSLNKLPPLKYYLDTEIINPKKSNMLWDYTCI